MPSLQLQSMFQSGPLSSADLSKFTGGAGARPCLACSFWQIPLSEPFNSYSNRSLMQLVLLASLSRG